MSKESEVQDLILNILPFKHSSDWIEVGFYTEKQSGMWPLQEYEFPLGFKDMDPNPTEGLENIYTDFGSPEEAEITLKVDLNHSRHFAAHYYNHLVYKAMRGVAHFRRRNFINNNQLWFRDEARDHNGLAAFKKIVVKASVGRYTGGPELTVMFDGYSYVHPQPVQAYPGSTTELNYVLYGGNCFRYDDIPPDFDIDYEKVYPVMNRSMYHRLDLSPAYRRINNKVAHYYEHMEWFREEVLEADAFQEVLPVPTGSWLAVDKVTRTSPESNRLRFGSGKTSRMPYYGMRNYGPCRPPEQKHFRIFFIMHENDRKAEGAELYRYLDGQKKGFRGLASFVNLPMELLDEHLIFTDEENPHAEVAEQLQQMELNPDFHYLAIYLSPISKDDPDPDRHRVYYRMKETLLKYGISSQVVERASVQDSGFKYALPNIAVAVLAKLGGVPWKLDEPPAPELVVGVGAFKARDMEEQYIGNAFCFANDGTFRGFECFAKKETEMLAGSIREAVRRYAGEQPELNRLVIHFYKRMSYRERRPILQMLNELGLDIPVIVVSINKTDSRDIVLFDEVNPDKIPLSGMYRQLGDGAILLCNNTRYKRGDRNLRSYPFPVKMRIWRTDNEEKRSWKETQRLVEQVYQFSRIYWKSVTQQNLPVTIKYPEMVAQIFPYFESSAMPEFGKENLWFL